jgi:hypothetical protein
MRAIFKRVRWPLAIVVAYFVLWLLLSWISPHHGLISPDGNLDLLSAIATIVVLVARLVVLFGALPAIGYRLVVRDP